jgi:uncharacterized protein (DUF1697 family)
MHLCAERKRDFQDRGEGPRFARQANPEENWTRVWVYPEVILRTSTELKDVIARNPYAKRREIEPGKLLIFFLAGNPGAEIREKLMNIKTDPEELKFDGREFYIYFPNGMGQAKMSWTTIERALKTPATGRNWNSVTKMFEMAEKLKAAE